MLKKLSGIAAFALIVISSVSAQTYEATIQQTIDGSTLNVDLYLRTTSGTSANLGDVTLSFTYNTSALTYVGKDAAFDGRWDDGSSASYNDIFGSSGGGRAGLNTQKTASGSGLDIPTSATRFGRLTFTITNASANSNIAWSTTFSDVRDWDGTSIKGSITFTNPEDISLPVTMTNFAVQASEQQGVVIEWSTASETGTIGFNVLRSEADQSHYSAINAELIRAEGGGSQGADYAFIDDKAVEDVLYWYQIEEIAANGEKTYYGPMSATGVKLIPTEFSLLQNYPNPFNPETKARYQLPDADDVEIAVYSILGQMVKTIYKGSQEAGYHDTVWDGTDSNGRPVPSGLYFLRLQAGSKVQTRKMTLLR